MVQSRKQKKQHGFTKTNPEKKWQTRGLLYFIHTFLLINILYYVTEENNVNLKVKYLIKLYTICIILHDTLAREFNTLNIFFFLYIIIFCRNFILSWSFKIETKNWDRWIFRGAGMDEKSKLKLIIYTCICTWPQSCLLQLTLIRNKKNFFLFYTYLLLFQTNKQVFSVSLSKFGYLSQFKI